MSRLSMLPSTFGTVSASGMISLSRFNGWPMLSPADASPVPSRDACARLGADVDRYSFIVVDLHHLLLAGCTGALGLRGHGVLPPRTVPAAQSDLRLRLRTGSALRGPWIPEAG